LSFRLFVVMVAVDARWLSRSLETKYKDFFGAVPGENSGTAHPVPGDVDGVGRATAADYLEKIFQVPYWVPPMTETSSVTLVEDLVSPDRAADLKRQVPPGKEPPHVPPTPPRPQPDVVEPEDDQHQGRSPPIPALGLTSNEIATLATLAPFLGGSPRRARRFINVYRVAKASLAPDEIKKLEDGEYRALATHLAIATGAPNIFGAWAMASRHSSKPVEERLSEIKSDDRLGHLLIRNEEWENFRKALKV